MPATLTALPTVATCHQLIVQLANNEWGNDVMQRVALEYLHDPAHAGLDPFIVTIWEHAGWSLTFTLLDGKLVVVGSANDGARFHGPALEFRERCHAMQRDLVEVIRRGQGA